MIQAVFLILVICIVGTQIRYFIEVKGLLNVRPFTLPFIPGRGYLYNAFMVTVYQLFNKSHFYLLIIAFFLILRKLKFIGGLINETLLFSLLYFLINLAILLFFKKNSENLIKEIIIIALLLGPIVVAVSHRLFGAHRNADSK